MDGLNGHKIMCMNSSFYTKLVANTPLPNGFEAVEHTQSLSNRKVANYAMVERWYNNVFDHDFIFVPIVSRGHWLLMVICSPGTTDDDGTPEVSQSKYGRGAILCFDSKTRSKIVTDDFVDPLLEYLNMQWVKEKGVIGRVDFRKCRFVRMRVGQQRNNYDCGVCMLMVAKKVAEKLPMEWPLLMGEETSDLCLKFADSYRISLINRYRKQLRSELQRLKGVN